MCHLSHGEKVSSHEAALPHAHPRIHTQARHFARGPDQHSGPMTCTWAQWSACGQRRPRARLVVHVRIKGLTRMFRGSRANNTPRQTANPPKCRPIQPKQAIFSDFRPMGLHFGGHTTSNRGHAATTRGGNCAIQASDTPATRGKKASHGAKPPSPHSKQATRPAHTTNWIGNNNLDRLLRSG